MYYWHDLGGLGTSPNGGRQQQYVVTVPRRGGVTPREPGWIDNRAVICPYVHPHLLQEGIICYLCYDRHHLAIEYNLPARGLPRFVTN